MTPDQSPARGTNLNQFYRLRDGKLRPDSANVWRIETQEIELRLESGEIERFIITDFVPSMPVTKREAAHTLSPDVSKLPPEYQRATWDL
jgi:hypothetical protein